MLESKQHIASIKDSGDLDLDERTSIQIDKETNQLVDKLQNFPLYEGRSKKWIIRHLIEKELELQKKSKQMEATA